MNLLNTCNFTKPNFPFEFLNNQTKVEEEIEKNLEGPNVRVIKSTEGLLDVEEPALVLTEIDGVAALEVDLDEDQTLVVLALNGLEEAASA